MKKGLAVIISIVLVVVIFLFLGSILLSAYLIWRRFLRLVGAFTLIILAVVVGWLLLSAKFKDK